MIRYGFSRINVIGFLFTLIGIIIIAQIIRIQTSTSAQIISEEARNNYEFRLERVYPERGYIYDRWGHLLAGNKEVYEVGVDLNTVRNPETIAKTLSMILDLDYSDVYRKADQDYEKGISEYIVLVNFVDPQKIAQLEGVRNEYSENPPKIKKGEMAPSLSGLIWQPHLQRTYPENTLAANILGFYAFRDPEHGKPYFGVEEEYNDLLSGTPIEVIVPIDPNKIQDVPSAPPGSSLVLTLDREIQAKVEEIIDGAVERHKAESGTVIVLDPESGEVLAMATTPRLNPNKYWELDEIFEGSTPYNRAVGESFEPGSVFKVITMAIAIDNGTVLPNTQFLDTGIISIGGIDIYNWDRSAWGPQDMIGCMQHSLNVCLAWVASKVGATEYYDYLENFGIGHRTNIDLAGEVLWPLSVPGDTGWWEANLGTNSFGQGVSVTPIQFVGAVSALANDGKMMAPHVLKAVVEDDREYTYSPQVIGNPISQDTARTITNMLAISLEEEASTALVPGYKLAGKTGTAEIPGPYGYTNSATNASFVGWGPTDDPQFVVFVWLEKPGTSPWGSIVAAPIFNEIVQDLVVLMDIPPDDTRQVLMNR